MPKCMACGAETDYAPYHYYTYGRVGLLCPRCVNTGAASRLREIDKLQETIRRLEDIHGGYDETAEALKAKIARGDYKEARERRR